MARKNRKSTTAATNQHEKEEQRKSASQHTHTDKQPEGKSKEEEELERCLSACTKLQAEINNKVSWLSSFDTAHKELTNVQAYLPSKDDLDDIISAATSKVISQRQRESKKVDNLHYPEFYGFDSPTSVKEVQESREGEKEKLKQKMVDFKRTFNVEDTPARGKRGKQQSGQGQVVNTEDLIQRIYKSWKNGDYGGLAKLTQIIDEVELLLKDILDDHAFWDLIKGKVSNISEQHNQVKPDLKKRQVENLSTLRDAEKKLEGIKEYAVRTEQEVRSRFQYQLEDLNGLLKGAHKRK